MTKTLFLIFPALAALAVLSGCAGKENMLRGGPLMAYPLEREPLAGDIYHVPTGLQVSFDEAMEIIGGAQVVYVGENHTNLQAHRVQLEILQELERRHPGKVALGMEMFRRPQQESLDGWVAGEFTEQEFLKSSRWYENWSDFGYYRDILLFARDKGMDLIALNPSRELQREVSMSAGKELPPELEEQLPEIGPGDPFQKEMIRAVFRGHDASDSAFESFYTIQLLWEETMAARIVEYLDSPAGEGKKIVILAGGMHVQHGFGIPKKVLRRRAAPYVIVIPEEIEIPEEKREQVLMDVDLPDLPLHRGDFLWLVSYEDLEDDRVLLGVMMASRDGKVFVEKVIPDSAAQEAGILEGDELVSLDGAPVAEPGDVVLTVRSKKPGDSLTVVVRRGEELLQLEPRFAEAEKD